MQSHTSLNPVSEGVKLTKTAARRFVDLASLVQNDDGTWTVPSSTDKKISYTITPYVDGIMECTCPAKSTWYQEQDCKHITALKTRLLKERHQATKISQVTQSVKDAVAGATLAILAATMRNAGPIMETANVLTTLTGAH